MSHVLVFPHNMEEEMQSSVYFRLKGKTRRNVTRVFVTFVAHDKSFSMDHMEHCIYRNTVYCLLKGQTGNTLGTVHYTFSLQLLFNWSSKTN